MSQLSTKQQAAIHKLLTCPTVKEAAVAAKVSEATLFRWLALPAFQAELQQMRGRVLETTLTSLQGASGQAVTTLQAIMKDSKAPAAARVSACRTVLETTLKAREQLELETRLQALERQIATKGSQ